MKGRRDGFAVTDSPTARELGIHMGLALGSLAAALAVSLLAAVLLRETTGSATAEHGAIVSILVAAGAVLGAMAFRQTAATRQQRLLVLAVGVWAAVGVADTMTDWRWTVPGVLACWACLFLDLDVPARFAVTTLNVPATGMFLLDLGGPWAETGALAAILAIYHLLAWLTVPARKPWKQAPLWPLLFGGLMALGVALYYLLQGMTAGRLQLAAVVVAFNILIGLLMAKRPFDALRVRPPITLKPATPVPIP